jgi:uncharacterized protein
MYLPDANFWLSLAFQSHQFHARANAWMRSAMPRSCCLCRVTQMGFLRLATNPKVLPGYTLSMTDAWTVYERIFSDERVVFAEEAANIEVVWKRFTQQTTFSTNVWTDAYLAAFAETAELELVTFDQAFARYVGLKHTILS